MKEPNNSLTRVAVARWRLKHRLHSVVDNAIFPVFTVSATSLLLGVDSTSYAKAETNASWFEAMSSILSAALSFLGFF